MAHRVTDAGITSPLIDSDHGAIFMKLRIMKWLYKKIEPRQKNDVARSLKTFR